MNNSRKYTSIHPDDNVLVALQDLPAGAAVDYLQHNFQLTTPVAAKHKIFVYDMAAGDDVIMYGLLVGKVQADVKKGSVMTTANTKHAAEKYAYRNYRYQWKVPDVSKFLNRTFNGYIREDGRVGTANYWLFIPTVFCENRNLDVIKEALHHTLGYAITDKYKLYATQLIAAFENGEDIHSFCEKEFNIASPKRIFENIDGIKFLNHQGGCGGTRQDAEMLGKLLAAYADHPNVAGVTLLSLGCQHLQVSNFITDLKKRNPQFNKPLLVFEQQQMKSEEALIKEAILKTFAKLVEVNKFKRQPASLDKLTIGVKCGGSDGFSGISANPAVGYAADLLVALGGKVLLAEFPELCGAEQNLIDRSVNKEVAEKFILLMEEYDEQAHKVGRDFR